MPTKEYILIIRIISFYKLVSFLKYSHWQASLQITDDLYGDYSTNHSSFINSSGMKYSGI